MAQVTFGEIAKRKSGGNDNGGRQRGPSIDSILNKPITITNIEMDVGQDGPVLWIMTEEYKTEGWIRTGSKVLYKDASDVIKPQIDKGNTVSTHIEKRMSKSSGRAYYAFAFK